MAHRISVERTRELLNYDPDTGLFVWREAMATRAGSVAGSLDGSGYIQIRVDQRKYLAHRLAWLFVYGQWPSQELDHINRCKTDNRIANLREATAAQNQQNKSTLKNNTSGFPGISYDPRKKRWQARICLNAARKSLGYFDTAAAAAEAYRMESMKLHTHSPFKNRG